MEEWIRIRQRVLREGVSKRQILRETGMHWTTLEKILKYPSPPGYCRTKPPKKSKIGPYLSSPLMPAARNLERSIQSYWFDLMTMITLLPWSTPITM